MTKQSEIQESVHIKHQ